MFRNKSFSCLAFCYVQKDFKNSLKFFPFFYGYTGLLFLYNRYLLEEEKQIYFTG